MTSPEQYWQIPLDAPESYKKHMVAEVRDEVKAGVWKWRTVSRENHCWDAETMLIVAAHIHKVF